MGSGHYIAYAKNYYDKNWYKFDDSSVNRISEKEIVCKDAYVLFYRKRNSRLN
jgi:ubiquitin C-terminal hydrolase